MTQSFAAANGDYFYDKFSMIETWAKGDAEGFYGPSHDTTHLSVVGQSFAAVPLLNQIFPLLSGTGFGQWTVRYDGSSGLTFIRTSLVSGSNAAIEFFRSDGTNTNRFYSTLFEQRGQTMVISTSGSQPLGSAAYSDTYAVHLNAGSLGFGIASTVPRIAFLTTPGTASLGWMTNATTMRDSIAPDGSNFIAGTSQNGFVFDKLFSLAGGSTSRVRPAGLLNQYVSDVTAAATTAEQDMGGYTIPASGLANSGDCISFETTVSFGATATNKELRVYVNGTAIFDTTALLINGGSAQIRSLIRRLNGTSLSIETTCVSSNTTLGTQINYYASLAHATASTCAVKLTGQMGAGAAVGDIIERGYRFHFIPAP